MTFEELKAALAANAERVRAPIPVDLDGVGIVYVRPGTIADFEELGKNPTPDSESRFGRGLARLMCHENGERYSPQDVIDLGTLLLGQPEEMFQKIKAAATGEKKGSEPGN